MAHLTQRSFVSLNIAVLTISDTRTYDTDTSGDTLVDRLQTAGHMLIDRGIVMDDIYQIRARVSQWIADPQVQVVLMTGGTGFTARDNTPRRCCRCWTNRSTVLASCFARCPSPKSACRPCNRVPWPVSATVCWCVACPVRRARAAPPGTRFSSVNWTAAPARAISRRTSSHNSTRRSRPVRHAHERV